MPLEKLPEDMLNINNLIIKIKDNEKTGITNLLLALLYAYVSPFGAGHAHGILIVIR